MNPVLAVSAACAYATFQVRGSDGDLEEILNDCDYHFDHEQIRDSEIIGVDADNRQIAVRLDFEVPLDHAGQIAVMEDADYEFIGLQADWEDISVQAPTWL